LGKPHMTRAQFARSKAYDTAAKLHESELRLLSERTSFFLLGSSILVAGFLTFWVSNNDLKYPSNPLSWILYALAALGLFVCLLHYFSGKETARVALFWRSYMRALDTTAPIATLGHLRQPLHERQEYYDGESRLPKMSEDWGFERLPEITPVDREIIRISMRVLLGPVSWFFLPAGFYAFWVCVVAFLLDYQSVWFWWVLPVALTAIGFVVVCFTGLYRLGKSLWDTICSRKRGTQIPLGPDITMPEKKEQHASE